MTRILSFIGNLLKWKAAAATLVGAMLVGGTGIALAFTPMGYDLAQALTAGGHAMTTPTQMSGNKAADHNHAMAMTHGQSQQGKNASTCPGDPQAQQLAKEFSLSTAKNGSAMQVICALHEGTFKAMVNGKSVTLNHPLGYGDIEQLLTYVKSFAAKNGDTLNDGNVQQYVATALSACSTAQSLESCINDSVKDMTATPTPRATGKSTTPPPSHDHGKPTSTPTPLANN
jgi:hypothetical protein